MEVLRPSFLDSMGLRLLLFGGKGGVGKTTCAAAAALELAVSRPGESFLLVSTDPAHSLQDSLAGAAFPGNVQVVEIDAGESLNRFRAVHGATLREIAAAGSFLSDEDIERFLNLSLPGLDEVMAFLRISEWVDAGRHSCIVVDTAPSGHTLRLLQMPDWFRKWVSLLDALLAKRRYMRKTFGRSAGADGLDRFVAGWAETIARTSALLEDPSRCEFVAVAIPEPFSVRETAALRRDLETFRIPALNLIVNQVRPPASCRVCAAVHSLEADQIHELVSAAGAASVWTVDLMEQEARGLKELQRFWKAARPVSDTRSAIRPAATCAAGLAENPAALPARGTRLILFAGKGGVGKTTLACATAVRLAHDFPQTRILLVSTDPAGSLSACLGFEVGAGPAHVRLGLSAMQIDGPAQFEALRSSYARDVERFLQALAGRLDLAFDRVVFEKLLDLAPPGLDEIMALSGILDLLSHGRYDLLVLDSAPTGHFLRLMQLPSLVSEWLKAIFVVLLKNAALIELPEFAARLVDLSKSLKNFRELVTDRSSAILYAVSIPAAMAFEETRDLLTACDSLGIVAQAIFLNRMTPPGECRLCSALRRREQETASCFRRAFPGLHQVMVHRQTPVTGLDRLEEFSRGLFRESRGLAVEEPSDEYACK